MVVLDIYLRMFFYRRTQKAYRFRSNNKQNTNQYDAFLYSAMINNEIAIEKERGVGFDKKS